MGAVGVEAEEGGGYCFEPPERTLRPGGSCLKEDSEALRCAYFTREALKMVDVEGGFKLRDPTPEELDATVFEGERVGLEFRYSPWDADGASDMAVKRVDLGVPSRCGGKVTLRVLDTFVRGAMPSGPGECTSFEACVSHETDPSVIVLYFPE